MRTNGAPSDPDAARSLADRPAPPAADVRTFLVADVRGYTSHTQENGDEVLVVFGSAREALRTAVELQVRFRAHEDGVPIFPLGIGIGLEKQAF